jgi:hypothetical protein
MSLKYKREGYAQTRDALAWVGSYAPNLKFGLTLEDVFAGLEHGYQSVRAKLKDPDRIAQWQQSHAKLHAAHALFVKGNVHEAKRAMQEAEELFIRLRHIDGRPASRQRLGDTEHGANELDE